MIFRDCLTLAAHFCLLSEEYDLLSSGATDFGECKDSIDFLARCGNLVIREIAANYVQLKSREIIAASETGQVVYSQFGRRPTAILSAKKGGANVFYKEFPDRIELDQGGNIDFEYAYLPSMLSVDDVLPFGTTRPDERVIAYGIASEFYLIHGQVDEAVVWDKRYRDGLHAAQLKKSEQRVKRRGWW